MADCIGGGMEVSRFPQESFIPAFFPFSVLSHFSCSGEVPSKTSEAGAPAEPVTGSIV